MDIDITAGIITAVRNSEQSCVRIDGKNFPLPDTARIYPGFVDSHCHLIGLGMMAARVSLHGLSSPVECARRMAEKARLQEKGTWLFGFGWNQELWEGGAWPDRSILDAEIPDHPVVLQRVDTHACWINSMAIRLADILPMEIEGGEVVLDATGAPAGVLIDKAMVLVNRAVPEPTTEQKGKWISWSVRECLRLGITEVHDMNVEPGRLEAMTRVAEAGEMLLRCRVFLSGMKNEWRLLPRPTLLAPNVDTVGVKYFADGALGSRGALLLEPYSDAPSHGSRLIEEEELVEWGEEALAAGYCVATHAIGDGANRLVLDAYQTLRMEYPRGLLRIEHAQIVDDADVGRFASLNIVPAIQPVHCISDADMAMARLGPDRCRAAYRWKSLLLTGIPLMGGSDFPIESADPRDGMRAFVDRQPDGAHGAWYGDERISNVAALRAYTEWAQRGVPVAAKRGRVAVGFDADLAVVDGDPLGYGDVIATFVAGVPLYRRDGL